jgi:hypothetical protein
MSATKAAPASGGFTHCRLRCGLRPPDRVVAGALDNVQFDDLLLEAGAIEIARALEISRVPVDLLVTFDPLSPEASPGQCGAGDQLLSARRLGVGARSRDRLPRQARQQRPRSRLDYHSLQHRQRWRDLLSPAGSRLRLPRTCLQVATFWPPANSRSVERTPLLRPADETKWRSGGGRPMTPHPPRKLLRCAIYTRKSTEHNLDLEFNSLDAQREVCEAYIKSQAHEAGGWS